MLDVRGKLIRVGDRLRVGGNWTTGVVVASMDTDECPDGAWDYLGRGIMVDTEAAGLIHYTENSDELEIIEPSAT